MSDVLSKVVDRNEWIFWCPGCKCCHFINASWQLSGTLERPTVKPSILVRGHDNETGKDTRCHIYVTDGRIRFLSDCTHELAGTTVEMAPMNETP